MPTHNRHAIGPTIPAAWTSRVRGRWCSTAAMASPNPSSCCRRPKRRCRARHWPTTLPPAPAPPAPVAATPTAPPPPAPAIAAAPAPIVAAAPPPIAAIAPPPPPAAAPHAQAIPPAPAPAVAAAPPKTAPPLAEGKGYRLQLAAVRSPEAAKQIWDRLKRQHGDVLGGLAYAEQRVDLGERGIFYRVQAGPIADAAKAEQECRELKRRGVGCLLVRP